MKNIFKSIIVGFGLLGTFACSDFLDQKSPSELTKDNVFNNSYYANLALNKVYGDLTQDYTYSQYLSIVWPLNSDCELVDGLGSDADNSSSERGNMNYNSNPGWANLARNWDMMYGIIENANLVIEGVEASPVLEQAGSERTAMLRIRGEALTLRAMIYYDLIKSFGDVPMKMESTNPDLSNAYIGKTDRDEIMDRLIVDLQEAISDLPWAGESGYSTEHITKGYAHALLANIALSRAGWNIRENYKDGYETAAISDPTYPTQRAGETKRKEMYELALTHLSAIINSNAHTLNPSIENHWFLINQRKLDDTYRENIFEIPMGLARSGELGYTVGVRANGYSTQYGRGNSSGKLKLTAPLLYSFDSKDLRRDLTCAHYQIVETDGVLQEQMLGNAPFGIYCAKWDIRKMDEAWREAAIKAGDAKCMTGINVVKMRYPQILLMYAEVVNELYGPTGTGGGTGLTAKQALTLVHTRPFADEDKADAAAYIEARSGSKEDFFNAIVDENAWELAGEGFRKYDLIRWNLLSSKIDEFKDTYLAQVYNGVYPKKLYYKMQEQDPTKIDMKSIQWYAEPDDVTGYENTSFFGTENDTQIEINLPSISSGLNKYVINRYLLPIGSTTISASNGMLYNSYGFTN